MRRQYLFLLWSFLALGLLPTAHCRAQLSFNVTTSGNSAADAAFTLATDAWLAEFQDAIEVNLDIGFSNLGGVTLANSSSANQLASFSDFKTALLGDATSADDQTYLSGLPSGSGFSVYINRTTEAGGLDNEVPYVDDDGGLNNTSVRMTTANAKALGLRAANDGSLDATIVFNSSFAWDFDRSDGIDLGTVDFIGVAMHEIGHALGFESGVDVLDANGDGLSSDDEFDFVSGIDFMRFSAESEGAGADIDWTADTREKYLSLDGGDTPLIGGLAHWSTGFDYGDGEQASHWKEGVSIGVMNPTISSGLIGTITATEVSVFDAIGYDRFASIPEPTAAWAIAGMGGWMLLRRRRHG